MNLVEGCAGAVGRKGIFRAANTRQAEAPLWH